jgi:TolB protein
MQSETNTRSAVRTFLGAAGLVVTSALVIAAPGGAIGAIRPDAVALTRAVAYSAGSQRGGVPYQVYVTQPGGTTTQITHAAIRQRTPAQPMWSPDGSRVLVAGDAGLYVVSADGSDEVRVGDTSGAARWSPDGEAIAYQVGTGLYVVDADGRMQHHLAGVVDGFFPEAWSWAPDGTRIAFAADGAVFTVNTTGTPHATKIPLRPRPADTSGARPHHAPAYTAAVWSPDGKRIAFQWDDGGATCCVNDWIYIANADGTGVTRIHRGSIRAWSPDGRKLAFAEGIVNDWSLSVVSATGSEIVRLPCSRSPEWLPDSSALTCLASGNQRIVSVRADGSHRRVLEEIATRRGTQYALSPDGSTVVYLAGHGANWNRCLYVVRTDGTSRRLVTRSATLRFAYPAWRPTNGKRLLAGKGTSHG